MDSEKQHQRLIAMYEAGSEACRNYSRLTMNTRTLSQQVLVLGVVGLSAAVASKEALRRPEIVLIGGFAILAFSISLRFVDWHYQSAFSAIRDSLAGLEKEWNNTNGPWRAHLSVRTGLKDHLASYMPFMLLSIFGFAGIVLGFALGGATDLPIAKIGWVALAIFTMLELGVLVILGLRAANKDKALLERLGPDKKESIPDPSGIQPRPRRETQNKPVPRSGGKKYVLFLQDLFPGPIEQSREKTQALLNKVAGESYEAIWTDDPNLPKVANEIEVLVTSEHEVNAALLFRYPNRMMISLAMTGYDQVDLDYCRRKNISAYYVPDYSKDSVAELTIGLTLAVLRKLVRADQNTRAGRWDGSGVQDGTQLRGKLVGRALAALRKLVRADQNTRAGLWDVVQPGTELRGKRVGIVGTGKIGIRSAELFKAFGCEVAGWAKTHRKAFLDLDLRYEDDLNKLLSDSDIVVLHLPVNRDTYQLIGTDELNCMQPGAILINTARSELVNAEALFNALKHNHLGGAGLDVFDREPALATNPLMALDNVVVTPHLGFKTTEALGRLANTAIENIGFYLSASKVNRLV